MSEKSISPSGIAAIAAIFLRCCAVSGLLFAVLLTRLFISPFLLTFGPTGRDDADDLSFVVVEFDCVGDQEQEIATYHPERLPAALTALNSVVTHLSVRIVKGNPAISKLTPCLRSFARALSGSHSKRIIVLIVISV